MSAVQSLTLISLSPLISGLFVFIIGEFVCLLVCLSLSTVPSLTSISPSISSQLKGKIGNFLTDLN